MLAYMESNPLKAGSNGELAVYLCQYHNWVNKRLDKDQQVCTDVGKLWGKDDCDCDVKKDDEEEKSGVGVHGSL